MRHGLLGRGFNIPGPLIFWDRRFSCVGMKAPRWDSTHGIEIPRSCSAKAFECDKYLVYTIESIYIHGSFAFQMFGLGGDDVD